MGLLIVKHAASEGRADIRDLVIVTYDPTRGAFGLMIAKSDPKLGKARDPI